MATSTFQTLNNRIIEFEEAIVEIVAAIDESDSSRIALQGTLDTVRESLANVYGDTLTEDVNEHLGLEIEETDEDE